jgi:hypothetical protein
MHITLCFKYMSPGSERPDDHCEYEVIADDGQLLVVPDVGDTVSYQPDEEEKRVARKVLTKHFVFGVASADDCHVVIVVTDPAKGEMLRRQHE